jgi:hypothetical protein
MAAAGVFLDTSVSRDAATRLETAGAGWRTDWVGHRVDIAVQEALTTFGEDQAGQVLQTWYRQTAELLREAGRTVAPNCLALFDGMCTGISMIEDAASQAAGRIRNLQ